jgi:hypothetical protein
VSLIGTVDTLPLADLFQVLAAAEKTGGLHVRSEHGLGIVYFAGGGVCAGEAGHRSGPVEGRPALVERVFDVCFELFRFQEASFEFEADGRPTWPAPDTVDVPEILAETARRLGEWADIQAIFPSLEVRPRLIPEAPEEGVLLDRDQWRVVAAIDGRRRVNAIIRVLDSTDFEVCRRLASLVEAGLVALDAPDPVALRPETVDPEDTADPPAERRRALVRPSRLAAVLEDDHWSSGERSPDEVANWDEQVLATTGSGFRRAVREAPREAVRETVPEAGAASEAEPEEVPEILPETSPAEEPEVLTSS